MNTISSSSAWVGILVGVLLFLGACDLPTSGPSFKTETGLNTPVVVEKTFTFLGGPSSENEVLIDTTTSQFDSLFTVAESDQSLSIEEEVSSFDIGSLDQALDEATEGVGVNTSVSETVIQGSDLATQDISVDQFRERNGRPPPTPEQSTTTPVADTTLPFPAALLAIPEFEIASIQADTVRRGTLTNETDFNGTVNELTFTLSNVNAASPPLTDGNGNGPTIRIEDESGQLIVEANFPDPIAPGDSDSETVDVSGKTFGKDSQLNLIVEGSDQDPQDELTLNLSPLRYLEATLAGDLQADVTATRTGVSTRGSTGSQFAGVETRSGTLQLAVTNNLQFPVQIDSLFLENNLQNPPVLPDSFQALEALGSVQSIDPGATKMVELDLADKGIAQSIDVRVSGGLADDRNVLTAAASDNIAVSASGSLTVGAMYFWPQGETVQAAGTFDFEQNRISFDRSGDYVELDGGTLALDNLVSEPSVAFNSLSLSFPEARDAPYAPEDSLVVQFSVPAEGSPEIDDVDLSDVRLSPTNNEFEYSLQGELETITNQTKENLRVVRFADQVRTDVSVSNLDVRALETGVTPFSVDVTEDANGDGRLDLADDKEATQESFDGLGGISDRVDGLQFTGSELNFRVTTNVGTDAQLFAALQGRGGNSRAFLAGRQEKSVPPDAPLGDSLVSGGTPIAKQNLIQLGIDGVSPGAPLNEPVTRSITLTDDNSTVDDFISALPTSLRFVAQARMIGKEVGGRQNNLIRLREPLQFDAGLSVSVPVKINGSFTVEDTVEADFSDLEDVTDPQKNVTVTSAELRVKYENGIPLGADARLFVLDGNDNQVLILPGNGERLRLDPAPKADNGTARGTQSGTVTLNLSKKELRDLAAGRRLRLQLMMDQADTGGPATLRASDTIELSLEAKVKASVTVE